MARKPTKRVPARANGGRSRSPAKVAAARANGRKRKARPRYDFGAGVAALPADAALAERAGAVAEALLASALSANLADREKRQELRATLKVVAPLIPKAELVRAARLLREEREDMQQTTKDPPLEKRPTTKGEPDA